MDRTLDEATRRRRVIVASSDPHSFIEGAAALAVSRKRARRAVAVARLAAKLALDGLGKYRALSYAGTLILGPRGQKRPT
jgi:hypothetical protein